MTNVILRLNLVSILIVLFTLPMAGQTASQIEKSFGKPVLAYSVTERIWMTPDFAADGQVCRMRFHPKRVDRYGSYLGGYLKFDELKWILNQIAPPSSRGARKSAFGLSTIGGGVAHTVFEYEKVALGFSSSFRIRGDFKSLRDLGEWVSLDDSFELSSELPKPPPPSEDDFDDAVPSEIAMLTWNDLPCVQNKDDVPIENRKVAEIVQKFGEPQKLYSVGNFTSMTPDYTADGQVCRMRLYPKRVSERVSYLGSTLQFGEVQSFLNTFFPAERRGLRWAVNSGTTFKGVESAWTAYRYKNVSFTFIAAPKSKSVPGVVKDHLRSKSDFQLADDVEIVIIQWKHRTCVH